MSDPYYSDEHVTLYSGEALAILQALPTASVDAVIADPPYSSGGMVRGDRATPGTHGKYQGDAVNHLPEFGGDSRDQRSYAYWSALWLSEARRVCKPAGLIMTFTDWRQLPATTDAIQAGGWVWRGIVPWFKPNTRPQSGRFTAQCEYVAWGSNGAMPVDRSAGTFPGFYQYQPERNKQHVTQKPLDLMRDLSRIVPPGGVILDPVMGSGTTGVAAVLDGRRFIGCEMSLHYADVAGRRIRKARGLSVPRGNQDALDLEAVS
jgi:site-specific DNA-methyltransferase (adenine-specific)